MRRKLLRLVLAAAIAALGVLAAGGCGPDGGKEGEGVLVQRQGSFEVRLPPGWDVTLPGSDSEQGPLFIGHGKDGALIVSLKEGRLDIEETAREAKASVSIELGEFERERDASMEMLIVKGEGTDRFSGKRGAVVLAVMRSRARLQETWVVTCVAEDLGKSPCEELVRGFKLLP